MRRSDHEEVPSAESLARKSRFFPHFRVLQLTPAVRCIQGLVTTTWAIVMTLMGVVQSYGGLLAARLALGVAEAGLFPVSDRKYRQGRRHDLTAGLFLGRHSVPLELVPSSPLAIPCRLFLRCRYSCGSFQWVRLGW